ncbi:MAG: Ig-like domain-containing protein [Candidatus Nanoarchaeia archaeon]|nr:Ig-like domain-containing protein [Candidatus Nanoarchaeia archaeon]MDD5239044.1 Ig-like domain-containing protein [Candidatus Nanoarchaeia archaeon]
MNSKGESRLNLILNRFGASKASASLKIFLALIIFGIASAFLLGVVFATHSYSPAPATVPNWTSSCGNSDEGPGPGDAMINLTKNITLTATGNDTSYLNLTLLNSTSNYTIQDFLTFYPASTLSCLKSSDTLIECTNTTANVLAGTGMTVQFNTSVNRSRLCMANGLDMFYWNISTLDNETSFNSTILIDKFDSQSPMPSGMMITSTKYTNGSNWFVTSPYDLTVPTGTDGSGSGINTSSCVYTTNMSGMPTVWTAATYADPNCTKTGITIADGVLHQSSLAVSDIAGNRGGSGSLDIYGDALAPTITWNSLASAYKLGTIVTLNVTAADAGSGVNTSAFTFNVSCTGSSNGSLGALTCTPGLVPKSTECTQAWTAPDAVANCNITANATDALGQTNTSIANLNIDFGCGDNISYSTVLIHNITGCTSGALFINTSNLVLDCDGYAIDGYDVTESGIEISPGIENVTIQDCIIWGYTDTAGIVGNGLGSSDGNISIVSNTFYSNGQAILLNATSAGSNDYDINSNIIYNTTDASKDAIYVGSSGNIYIDHNEIYSAASTGISVRSSSGTISNNVINNTLTGYGISTNAFAGVIELNNVSYAERGINYFASGPIANITNNTLNINDYGLYISSSMDISVWHNNVYNNTMNVLSTSPIELSYSSEGNYWGHDGCPVFSAGIDSNSATVIDSYAYNTSSGWLTTTPAFCAPQIITFADVFSGFAYANIGIGESMAMPFVLDVYVNITNTTPAWVNLTGAGGSLCMESYAPNVMLSYEDLGDGPVFNAECTLNKTILATLGPQHNLTAVAYYVSSPAITNTQNFTLNSDFERPVMNFGWWDTTGGDGTPVKFVSPENMFNRQDIFFSPTDNAVRIRVNVTDNSVVSYVEANMTSLDSAMALTGGNCSGVVNLTGVGGNFWEYNCSLGGFNRTFIQDVLNGGTFSPVFEGQTDVQIAAHDVFGNPTAIAYNTSEITPVECVGYVEGQCMSLVTPIVIHDIEVMGPTSISAIHDQIEEFSGCIWGANCSACGPGETPETDGCYEAAQLCFLFGSQTTNFSNVANFSDVNFSVEMQVNMSCLEEAGGIVTDIPMPTGHTTMMKVNFSSIDFNSQETAGKLAQLPENLNVYISPAGTFGDSYIMLNSSYFEMLNASATIVFYHLPFISAPYVYGIGGAVTATPTITWAPFNDDLWDGRPAGNLTFNVGGFSGYEITDSIKPTVVIDAPAAGTNLTVNTTWLNMTLNGTGTQISNVLVYDGAVLKYNYTANESMCLNVTLGSELFFCNISLTGLADGTHTLTVQAFDFGGNESPGNNNTTTRAFIIDSSAPNITITAPVSNAVLNAAMLPYNITGTAADNYVGISNITWYIDNAEQGTVDMSPLPLWWTSWNPSDGVYNITAQSCDYFSNCANATAVTLITVDALKPKISITYPTNNLNISSSTLVVNTTTNETNPNRLLVYVNGALTNNTTYSSGEQNNTIVLTLADGTYVVYATATDTAGNSNTTSNYTVMIDTTAPTLNIITPTNNSYQNRNNTIVNWTVNDTNYNYTYIELYNSTDDLAANGTVPYTFGPYTYPNYIVNWTDVPDEVYRLVLVAYDIVANNRTETVYNITVDTTAPKIAVSYPANNSNSTSSTVTINVTTNETNANSMKLYVGGLLVNTTSYTAGNNKVKTFTVSMADGNRTFYANATDLAGNYNATGTYYIIVDTTAPAMSSIFADTITNESADIHVTTNEIANCSVDFGTDTSYGSVASSVSGSGALSLAIPSAAQGTLYYYRWNCTDVYGTSGVSAGYTFTTANYQTDTIVNTTTTNMTFNFTEDGTNTTNAGVEISLNETIDATVKIAKGIAPTANFSASGITGLGTYYTIESDEINSTNAEWLMIKLYYEDSQVPIGINESTLRLYWYNTTSSAWEIITPGGVDTVNNYVWGNTTHFSEYTIAGAADTEVTAPTSPGGSSGGIPSAGLTHEVNLDVQVTYTQAGMAVKDKINFTLNGEKHVLTLSSMMIDQIVVDISSLSQRITVDMNTPKAVDLDGDGINDLELKLTKIIAGRADLTLTKITATGAAAEPEEVTVETPAEVPTEEPQPTVTVISEEIKAVSGNYGIYIVAAIALLGIIAVTYYVFFRKR